MRSVWAESRPHATFESQKGSVSTDVLVIGGGICGILCAYMLKRAGVNCVLAEAGRLCSGITENTTAKITLQHGLLYSKLTEKLGHYKAALYLQAQLQAMGEYDNLCRSIDCDYEIQDSFVYSRTDREKLEKEVKALERLGSKAELCESVGIPIKVSGAVCVPDQAQFHPLKFALEIAKGLPIYENTKILEIMPGKAKTEQGEILCKKIIVATHFPILNKHGGYFLKMYQHRSYVLALENAQELNGMYVDEDEKGLSFRRFGDLLLVGGGSHRTGKKGGSYSELEEFARVHYPLAKAFNKWATQDCMTLDSIPYIGQYSKSTPDLYVATGFNKWGMTSSMAAAMILTDLVLGRKNEYASVFSPSRSMLTPQLAVNAAESLIGLLTPTSPRCPHLGCALKYNPQEHSWDCPCHGSRFSKNGELIDNPATDDKKRKISSIKKR